MAHYDKLGEEIQRGIEGRNHSIPTGFKRLDKYVSIRKRIYLLIFGATGTGKTAFVHDAYILNPFDDWIAKGKPKARVKPILFSMERSKIYTQAKWLSRKIFLDNGILIPIGKMLGWWEEKLTLNEKNLVDTYSDYINELCEFVDVIEGAQNPTGIYKYVKAYAEKQGRIEEIDEYHKIYIPNNEDEVVEPIVDTFGLMKTEKGMSKKEAIDKGSEYFQIFRDFYGMSPIGISQVNRDLSNPIYQKIDNIEPNLDQVKESGRMAEDGDIVISLFQPSRYKTNDSLYDVSLFINPETGGDFFRKVKILKNTYGEADIPIGMAFMGAIGKFNELPRKTDMQNFDYSTLFNNSYFLK
jgi:replicative DNA helicase